MKRVKSVKAEPGYAIRVEFEDGLAGTIDLSSELYGPVFEPLRDPRVFELVYVDDFGVVRWPNGADVAPEALYQDLAEQMRRAS